MMRTLPLLVFIVLAMVFANMLNQKAQRSDAANVAHAPLPDLRVVSFDGKTRWDNASLKGQVTLINFYASWCSPCEMEMPELQALKAQFPQLKMEGIAWNDTPARLTPWLTKHGDPFDRRWIDSKGEAIFALGIRGIPESVIVDAEGTIRYRLAGPLSEDMRKGEIGQLITQLLAEASHAP